MLTFSFTGVQGAMTEKEMLVSGMMGKQVRFEFSEEWADLRKAAVYRAGDVTCTNLDIGQTDTIPAAVLAKPLQRLYVGVYGLSEDGALALPTVYVPGPFIRVGASADGDSAFDPADPFWVEMEEALAETVRYTPQSLTQAQQLQAQANLGISGGLTGTAAELLLAILTKGVYTEDVSGTLSALEEALAEVEIPVVPEEPEEPETVYYSVSCSLENVTASPASAQVEEGSGCSVTLTAAEGYVLDAVTVTMGGSDITASAYSAGTVTVAAVTGDVVITAKAAVEEPEVVTVAVTLALTEISVSNSQSTAVVGQSYENTLTPNDGYYIDTVAVTMDGADVTAEVLSGEKVSIASVTGPIVITAVAVVEPEPLNIYEIAHGTTSFASGTGLEVNRSDTVGGRATVIPTGQYLKKGVTYRFSLGGLSGYYFGVQILEAAEAGLTFDVLAGEHLYFSTVLSRDVDTGWMQADYTYTPTEHNRIFTMNFKRESGEFSDSHYAELLSNVFVEEVTE